MTIYFPQHDDNDVDFDKDIDVKVDFDLDIDSKTDIDKDVKVDVDVDVKTEVDGNLAHLLVDAEAVGKDTFVEVDAIVLTIENELSSIVLDVTSAT